MRNFDLSPLYRSTIGFDRLFNLVENAAAANNNGYPPYNIELLGEDRYRISMAVAGFKQEEIEIVSHENSLVVKGARAEEQVERKFLHQGIAERNFERKFQLADHVKVVSAALENGLLHVDLVREVPEEAKPKRIEIGKPALPNDA